MTMVVSHRSMPPPKVLDTDNSTHDQMILAEKYADLTHTLQKGEGEPFTFLLDGGPGIAHYLWEYFAPLDLPGCLIGFDPFGTGATKTPGDLTPSPENLALQFSGLVLKYAKPEKKIKIIAHSFGAVVLKLALDQVFKWHDYDITILMIDPCPFTARDAAESDLKLELLLMKNGVLKKETELQEKYELAIKEKNQEAINTIGAEMLAIQLPFYVSEKKAIPMVIPTCSNPFNPIFENKAEKCFVEKYTTYDWVEYRYPSKTTIISGSEDPFRVGPIPKSVSRFNTIDQAGHYSYAEQPGDFLDQTRDILFD